ncbi:MAG TPA: P pilus assembly protein, chaperone PapD [Cyanobacteria bacterium UBA8803]|nr:P pilus assembly protein, chaperone PapD [Cyanobacteria bacterium UBA9273]HBL61464.1 P pilus assembly protein, chaperone PapD [Cyanobacteria bacterium UBA8803]
MPNFLTSTLALLGILALTTAPVTAMEIGVSPPRLEIDMNSSQSSNQSIRVMNISSEPLEIQVYVNNWVLDENNEVQVVEPTEQSLDRWIVFNPSRIIIPPGQSQVVRFSIRPRVQPEVGEKRAMIFLQEVPPENSTGSVQGVGRFGVTVYAYFGEVERKGVINSIEVKPTSDSVTAVFDVSSAGTAHVRMKGQYAVWPADRYPGASETQPIANLGSPDAKIPEMVLDAGPLPSTPVLPDTERQILLNISKQLPPGNYVLDMNGELSGVPLDRGIPFTVPGGTVSASPQ